MRLAFMKKAEKTMVTISDKIRAMAQKGMPRADIARRLGKRYQHVRNVLEHDKKRAAKEIAKQSDGSLDSLKSQKIRIGPDGRVVIPASFREALKLNEGDALFARIEGGEIHLLTPRAAAQRAKAVVRRFVPEGVSLVDELIEDRRREARREAERG
jgi:AbrB family looped-hinge helix DNA binding protein